MAINRNRRFAGLLLVVIPVALFGLSTSSGRAADKTDSSGAPEAKLWAGKFVVLSVSHGLEKTRGFYLTEVRNESVGDQSFLVGKWFTPDGVLKKAVYWVPANRIDYMSVYDNLEDLKKEYEDSQEQK